MQHIKLDRKCLWSTEDLHLFLLLCSPTAPPPPALISAFSVFPAMFSSVYSFASFGSVRVRQKWGERRSSVAVNSSHLSPGLSFNCSALPAGSLLLWSSATLFFHCFSWISFCKTTVLRFLRQGVKLDHLLCCKCMSVLGISRTQCLSYAHWHPQHFEVFLFLTCVL